MKKTLLIGCGILLVVVLLCIGTSVAGYYAMSTLVEETIAISPSPLAPGRPVTLPTVWPTYTPRPDYTPPAPPLSRSIPYRAVVQILAETYRDGRLKPVWSGSGTIIDPRGFILTNAHVALSDPVTGERVDTLEILLTEAEDRPPVPRYYAEVVVADRHLDIAVLRVVTDLNGKAVDPESLNLPYVRLGNAESLHLGQPLIILGYPGIGGNTITLTRGEVSGFTWEANYGDRAFIKTSATIAGGNSGGMVANSAGELVAIPTMLGSGSNSGEVIDCRHLADTNGDGVIDDRDDCVPTGGFINALRPINLARPLIEAAGIHLAPYATPTPTLTPTPTVSPTPTPTPIAIATLPPGKIILRYDFSKPVEGWTREVGKVDETGYVDGEYHIFVKEGGWMVWRLASIVRDDVIVDVDAKPVDGNLQNGDFGIVCRQWDREHFYYFAVSGDGYYQIFRVSPGKSSLAFTSLTDGWHRSSIIHRGFSVVNHLRAACIGNKLTLAANGKVIVTAKDDHYAKGDVGVIVGTYDKVEGGLDVRFDNLVVYKP